MIRRSKNYAIQENKELLKEPYYQYGEEASDEVDAVERNF